jgi:hypothetical protein
MLASFSATKNHAWIPGASSSNAANPNSPNDAVFPIDNTWSWQFKVIGGYDLPFKIRVGGFYQLISGGQSERSYIFRSVPQASTVTLRLEPRGGQQEPTFNVVNLRVSKRFALSHGRALAIDADIFNLFNGNTMNTVSFAEGPTFGQPGDVLPPLIVRFGANFRF